MTYKLAMSPGALLAALVLAAAGCAMDPPPPAAPASESPAGTSTASQAELVCTPDGELLSSSFGCARGTQVPMWTDECCSGFALGTCTSARVLEFRCRAS